MGYLGVRFCAFGHGGSVIGHLFIVFFRAQSLKYMVLALMKLTLRARLLQKLAALCLLGLNLMPTRHSLGYLEEHYRPLEPFLLLNESDSACDIVPEKPITVLDLLSQYELFQLSIQQDLTS